MQSSVDATVKKMSDAQATLTKIVDTYSKKITSLKREQTDRAGEVKKRMDTLQQNCMNPTGLELQIRDMDSKFRRELEKIRNNESGERTKFQVEIERNLETKLEELGVAFREHKTMCQIGKSQNAE